MDDKKIKKIERIFCIVTGIIALVLAIAACVNYIFIPAACTMLALCLFGLWYMYKDDSSKKTIGLIMFVVGVALVIFAVTYTIVKTS